MDGVFALLFLCFIAGVQSPRSGFRLTPPGAGGNVVWFVSDAFIVAESFRAEVSGIVSLYIHFHDSRMTLCRSDSCDVV